MESFGVRAGGDDECAGGVDPDAVLVNEIGCGSSDEHGELAVESADLVVVEHEALSEHLKCVTRRHGRLGEVAARPEFGASLRESHGCEFGKLGPECLGADVDDRANLVDHGRCDR